MGASGAGGEARAGRRAAGLGEAVPSLSSPLLSSLSLASPSSTAERSRALQRAARRGPAQPSALPAPRGGGEEGRGPAPPPAPPGSARPRRGAAGPRTPSAGRSRAERRRRGPAPGGGPAQPSAGRCGGARGCCAPARPERERRAERSAACAGSQPPEGRGAAEPGRRLTRRPGPRGGRRAPEASARSGRGWVSTGCRAAFCRRALGWRSRRLPSRPRSCPLLPFWSRGRGVGKPCGCQGRSGRFLVLAGWSRAQSSPEDAPEACSAAPAEGLCIEAPLPPVPLLEATLLSSAGCICVLFLYVTCLLLWNSAAVSILREGAVGNTAGSWPYSAALRPSVKQTDVPPMQ